MGALVEEIASLTAAGKQVMLISSGAVGLGRERVGLSKEVVANVKNVVERQVHITYKT
jgi:glutamate 5-kinase